MIFISRLLVPTSLGFKSSSESAYFKKENIRISV